jgi:hypothetical protein
MDGREPGIQATGCENISAWKLPARRKLHMLHARKPFRCCDCARHFRTEDAARRHWRDVHAQHEGSQE